MAERKEFVSKLIFRVLVGSVKGQVLAFREAWQSVFPSAWLASVQAQAQASSGSKGVGAETATEVISRGGLALSMFAPEEVAQAILSLPSSSSSALAATSLEIADLRAATEVVLPSHSSLKGEAFEVVNWFWTLWTTLPPLKQRRLLAFITGAEDLPATGARGVGLRLHLVPSSFAADEVVEDRNWPLPWSSTCTSTLFLPSYPSEGLLEEKVGVAIEHYQGFGLR